jgi:hypothetical protein
MSGLVWTGEQSRGRRVVVGIQGEKEGRRAARSWTTSLAGSLPVVMITPIMPITRNPPSLPYDTLLNSNNLLFRTPPSSLSSILCIRQAIPLRPLLPISLSLSSLRRLLNKRTTLLPLLLDIFPPRTERCLTCSPLLFLRLRLPLPPSRHLLRSQGSLL